MAQLLRYLMHAYCRIRFGKLTPVVIESVNGTPCEILYLDRKGREVGYWAYGHFHPAYPYRGWLH